MPTENTPVMPKIVALDTSNWVSRKPRSNSATATRLEMLRNAHKEGKKLLFPNRKTAMPFLLLPRLFNEKIELDHAENPDANAKGEVFAVWPSKAIPAKLTRKTAEPAKAK